MMASCLCWLNPLADLLRLLALGLRSKTSLAAENLFLRKQLAFYQEPKIRSRRLDDPTRLTLVWLSRWFDWPVEEASIPITLKLPPRTVRVLRAYAASSGLTLGEIVTRALVAFMSALRRHG
jgi:hypothetical protein